MSWVKNGHFQPGAILPVAIMIAAFVLSFLLVFAGNKPGFMEDYAAFTLNTSRIGQNLIHDFDNKITSLNFSHIVDTDAKMKRDVVASVVQWNPVITPAPSMAQMAERGVGDIFDSLTSEVGGDFSAVESKASSVKSAVEGQASAVESLIVSKVNSALATAETAIVRAVNDAYEDLIEHMNLTDFYSVHMLTTCTGEYAYPNGTNVTVDVSAYPAANTTLHRHVDSCERHSDIDPVELIRILYEIGIALTGAALVLAVWGCINFSKTMAVINIMGTFPALLFIGLASAATHGLALGAAHLVNFIGEDIGIQASAGRKFIAMTWVTTALLLVSIIAWSVLACVDGKMTRKSGGSKREMKEKTFDQGSLGQR